MRLQSILIQDELDDKSDRNKTENETMIIFVFLLSNQENERSRGRPTTMKRLISCKTI